MNVLAHIATNDMLHWRHEPFGSIGMIDAKYGGWTFHFESNMMAKITNKVYADIIRCSRSSSQTGAIVQTLLLMNF